MRTHFAGCVLEDEGLRHSQPISPSGHVPQKRSLDRSGLDVRVSTLCAEEKLTALVPSVEAEAVAVSPRTQEMLAMPKAGLLAASKSAPPANDRAERQARNRPTLSMATKVPTAISRPRCRSEGRGCFVAGYLCETHEHLGRTVKSSCSSKGGQARPVRYLSQQRSHSRLCRRLVPSHVHAKHRKWPETSAHRDGGGAKSTDHRCRTRVRRVVFPKMLGQNWAGGHPVGVAVAILQRLQNVRHEADPLNQNMWALSDHFFFSFLLDMQTCVSPVIPEDLHAAGQFVLMHIHAGLTSVLKGSSSSSRILQNHCGIDWWRSGSWRTCSYQGTSIFWVVRSANEKTNQKIVEENGKLLESQISARAIGPLPACEKSWANILPWSHHMEGHVRKCVGRCYALANKNVEQLCQVSVPCFDDHCVKKDTLQRVGELLEVCSHMVLNGFYVARIGRPHILM